MYLIKGVLGVEVSGTVAFPLSPDCSGNKDSGAIIPSQSGVLPKCFMQVNRRVEIVSARNKAHIFKCFYPQNVVCF